MGFDEGLAERVREVLRGRLDVVERRMFGGLAFMVRGHMCCGVLGEELVLRLGEEGASRAMSEPHTRAMDFTGRPMKSMVYVSAGGVAEDEDLASWIERAVAFAESLPAK